MQTQCKILTPYTTAKDLIITVINRRAVSKSPHRIPRWRLHKPSMAGNDFKQRKNQKKSQPHL